LYSFIIKKKEVWGQHETPGYQGAIAPGGPVHPPHPLQPALTLDFGGKKKPKQKNKNCL